MDCEMEWEGGDGDVEEDDSGSSDWRVYVKGKTAEPLESWLQRNAPSTITKQGDGVEWISVVRHDNSDDDKADVGGLMESWAQLQASGRSINFPAIKEIACNHNVTSGKWCLFASTGVKVDHFWSLIAHHVVEDASFPCLSAKVSAASLEDRWTQDHVICMYTNNFCDEDEIMQADEAIRRIGIKSELFYKPDVYTYLNIYSSKVKTNPWGLKPVIMRSEFDILQGRSIIKERIHR